MKEYVKIDLDTGEIVEPVLYDDSKNPPPEDLKAPWDGFTPFYKPVWSFEKDMWIESLSIEEIIRPVRERRIKEISNECEIIIKYGFEYLGDFFAFQDKDQTNFNQQLSLMLLDSTLESVVWKTENNGVKIFDRNHFIEVCKAGERHKRQMISKYWQVKNYVETTNFASADEINAINMNTDVSLLMEEQGS